MDGTDAYEFKQHFGRSQIQAPCPPDGPAPAPKTGQATSYYEGDDGGLQRGVAWPNPRFTDNGDGTVTDNLTGLIWLKNANCFGLKTWVQALTDCIGLANDQCGLTDGSSPGDWRLPNVFEVQSLLDLRYWEPALPNTAGTGQWTLGNPFTNLITDNRYWSSTTYAISGIEAWFVIMYNGNVGFDDKGSFYCVWPVRAGH